MMKAVRTPETLANVYETKRLNIPEDSHLHGCSHDNLNFTEKGIAAYKGVRGHRQLERR
jgi:hypothetical protein